VTTNAPFTLANGDTVTVSGIDGIVNATPTVTNPTSSTFSYTPPPFRLNVTNKALSGGLATLKLNSTAGLANGDTVNIAGVDSLLLDGTFNVNVVGGNNIAYPDSARQDMAVTSRSISGTTATINTAATHTFANGDRVNVNTGTRVSTATIARRSTRAVRAS